MAYQSRRGCWSKCRKLYWTDHREEGAKFVVRNEKDPHLVGACPPSDCSTQGHDARKRLDPTTRFRIPDDVRGANRQSSSVIARRSFGIWSLLLRLQVLLGIEVDFGEEVPSDSRDPRYRDKVTFPERFRFVVQGVNHVIEDLRAVLTLWFRWKVTRPIWCQFRVAVRPYPEPRSCPEPNLNAKCPGGAFNGVFYQL